MPPKKLKLSDDEKFTLIDEVGSRNVIWNPILEEHKKRKNVDDEFDKIATFMTEGNRKFTGTFKA